MVTKAAWNQYFGRGGLPRLAPANAAIEVAFAIECEEIDAETAVHDAERAVAALSPRDPDTNRVNADQWMKRHCRAAEYVLVDGRTVDLHGARAALAEFWGALAVARRRSQRAREWRDRIEREVRAARDAYWGIGA